MAAETEFTVVPPHSFFFRAAGELEFDMMEQSLSSYLRSRAMGG